MRSTGFVVVVTAAVVAVGLVATPAQAAPVTVGADASTWQVDGRVDAVAYSPDGSVAYLAGTFHTMCPPTDATCTSTTSDGWAVDNLAAITVSTGAPITTWRPQPDGEVSAVTVASSGLVYAGGVFNHVSGATHHRLAAIDASTGVAVKTWKPNVSAQVKAIALSPDQSVVYIGGTFLKVNLVARGRLAAVTAYSSTATAATLLPWDPEPNGTDTIDKGSTIPSIVNTLVVRPTDGEVFVGGVFTAIGGLARSNVAGVLPATGGGTGVGDAGFTMNPALHYVVINVDLTRDGSTLFASGRGPGGFLRAYDSASGSQLWARRFDGDVQAAVATDTIVYVGGHFDNVAITGTALTDVRHHLAAFDAATGATDPWSPTANSVFGVYGMAWSPQHVLAGGDFTTINRVAHGGVAQFTGGDSVPPTAVTDLTVSSTAKGRVDLSWSPVSDSDSATVTYRVYRRPTSGTFALLSTVSGATGGGGPITWSDATATIGASYQYQVRAADPVYLAAAGNTAGPVTVAGDQVPPGTPTAVSATATAPGVATISWQGGGDSDDPSVTYAVTRWTSGGSTALPPMTGAPSGTVTTTDALPAGGTAWYSVTASDGTFTSLASAVSNTIVIGVDAAKPTVPTGLAVASNAANTMTVSWTASTDADLPTGQIQYVVYRKLKSDAGTGTAIGTTRPGDTSYTDLTSAANGPLPDKAYTYYVAATDGAQTSTKTAGVSGTVSSSIFTDAFTSLFAWTPPLSPSGASLDATKGHGDSSSALLTSVVSPRTYGYLHRSFGASYRTVCVQEWVAMSAYDTRGTGQSTLMRVYSTGGLDVARLYVDPKGALWVRGDFGSNPAVTTVVVPADGSWHSAQLCATTTPDSVNGSLTVYWDGVTKGTLTGVDNSPDTLASVDIGDTSAEGYSMWIDDVSVGTTKR